MVLSLFDICRISIRDSIENGKFRDVSSLPPILRQSILDMILMHQTINNPNCLATLSSVNFLRNLTSFSTQCGKIDDDRFLKQVRKSMRSIGSSIEELRLNLYGSKFKNEYGDKEFRETNFRNAIQLIKQCVNLKILNLDMFKIRPNVAARDKEIDDPESEVDEESESLTIFEQTAYGGLLCNCTAMKPCLSVMENLEELSLDGYPGAPFLLDDYPIIKLKKLRKLRLRNCKVDKTAWHCFLISIRKTLISLDVKSTEILPSVADHFNNVLPISLPHLKSLITDAAINKPFLDNLADCKALEYVRLYFDASEEEADLLALNRMNFFQLDVNVFIELRGGRHSNANRIFDNESKFKLVDIFKEKVKKFVLHVLDKDILFATALEQVVDVCRNLTKFDFRVMQEKSVFEREGERINSALVRLFSDELRASKIRCLIMLADVDIKVLESVFQNCVNMESLSMQQCRRLCDDHIIGWALRGARPSSIYIHDCPNVGDAGLIPILVSSGGRLNQFSICAGNGVGNMANVGESTWRVLADHCRYVVSVSGIPETFDDLLEEKCFNKNVIER